VRIEEDKGDDDDRSEVGAVLLRVKRFVLRLFARRSEDRFDEEQLGGVKVDGPASIARVTSARAGNDAIEAWLEVLRRAKRAISALLRSKRGIVVSISVGGNRSLITSSGRVKSTVVSVQ
jgi:hypothetical protein